jgi:hypothetical protein
MKKVLISSVLAIALVGSGSTAFAASTKPSIKPTIKSTKGGEGTASHEMSESSSTQNEEGSGTPAKKIPAKKIPSMKASTKATTKKK